MAMGVNLTPISVRRTIDLEELRGRVLAVDALGELYQFLALIRRPDGTPLMDARGHITSHLSGLLYRTTRLVGEHGMRLVFVFDGRPPALKGAEIERRRAVRERYTEEHRQAVADGDLARAFSKSTMTSRISPGMLDDARRLLDLLGIPWLNAPGEGEAQAAFLAAKGVAWAAASKDYDALLFGAPRLVRFLTISGKEFLPSKGTSRPITPELIDREEMLAALGVSGEALIDLAILVGTDFNRGVKGIGPKTALKLLRLHGSIEGLPEDVRSRVDPSYPEVRDVFLHPPVGAAYAPRWGKPDAEGLCEFLCGERDFSEERVRNALERMEGGRTGGG
jgi:flap endonuclease-1